MRVITLNVNGMRSAARKGLLRQRRVALRGFVVETLRLATLIRGALPEPESEGLEFRLVDATGTLSEQTIFASARAETAMRSPLRSAAWITVVDRQWRLELYAAPWHLSARQSERAWIVLGRGLFVTILLGAYPLASARHPAEVEELAEGLRKSRALEQSPASVVITDTKGAIEYVNPKFAQVTGYDWCTYHDSLRVAFYLAQGGHRWLQRTPATPALRRRCKCCCWLD